MRQQITRHRSPRAHHRYGLQHRRPHQIQQRIERRLQNRTKQLQLPPILIQKTLKGLGILDIDAGNLLLHPLDVRRRINATTRTKLQTVLGIQACHRALGTQITPHRLKNFVQYPRIQKECGAVIKAKTLSLQRRTTPARSRQPINYGDLRTSLRQQHRRRQTTGTGPDHANSVAPLRHPCCVLLLVSDHLTPFPELCRFAKTRTMPNVRNRPQAES